MIKNLIFDFGGVVVLLNPEEAYRRFEALGIRDTRQQMGVYGHYGIFLDLENGTIDADTFCCRLAEQAKEQSDFFADVEHPKYSFEQAQWAWLGFVKDVPMERLNNLLRLKEKYNVYLLSNINPFMRAWMSSTEFSGDGHPIDYYFHQLFCSYELKDYKPSESIYRKVLELASIKAEETVFIDDGMNNVLAAEALGIHGVHVPKDEDWMDALEEIIGNR